MNLSPARSPRTVGIAAAVVLAFVAVASLMTFGLEWRLQRQNPETEQANADRDARKVAFLKAVASLARTLLTRTREDWPSPDRMVRRAGQGHRRRDLSSGDCRGIRLELHDWPRRRSAGGTRALLVDPGTATP